MLAGRRIVIAGIGGIGEHIAQCAAGLGARLHLIDIDGARASAVAAALDATSSAADLRNFDRTDDAVRQAVSDLGGVDGVVAIAGGSGRAFGDGPVDGLTESALAKTLDSNLTPAALTLGAFLRHRDRNVHGAAVLIGSVLARHPHRLFATHGYAAAKAAIEGLAIAAANYYADQDVSINVVAPGLTRTPMSARAQTDETTRRFARERQPLTVDGFIDPAPVAFACCAVLANPAVTGQVLGVDAGWSVT